MVVLAFLVYFIIRGAVVNRAGEAIAHGLSVIHLEQRLGIYWEPDLQSSIVDRYWMVKTANWIYFWAHMPLIVVGAVWLYIRHRPAYHLTRNAFLASGAIGVVIYALYPVAPPRLIPIAGFIDTMRLFDKVGYQTEELGAFVNPYAAVPVSWPLHSLALASGFTASPCQGDGAACKDTFRWTGHIVLQAVS